MEMEYSKLMEKTNAVLIHLDNVDVGALDPAIRAAVKAAQVEGLTTKQYGQFWAGIRTLCSTLPKEISPIGHGASSSLPTEVQSYVISAAQTIRNAIVAIGETDPTAASLMVELVMPARLTKKQREFSDINELATYYGNRAGDYAKDAYADKRWDGKVRKDGTLGVTHVEVKATEESE